MNSTHDQPSNFKLLDQSGVSLYLTAMLTRKHIELGAKLYIVAHLIVFVIYFVKVMKMMSFFGG